MKTEQVIYTPGETRINTMLINGRGAYSGKTIMELLDEYPGSIVTDWESALKLISEAMEQKYDNKPWLEISEDDFCEMLDVLPPINWESGTGWEAFQMSEMTEGPYTGTYVRLNGHYYTAPREAPADYSQLKKEIANQLKQEN